VFDLAKQKAAELVRWQQCIVLSPYIALMDNVAKRLLGNKNRYVTVQNLSGVPWPVTAVIHERESSQSWAANLANGDPWNKPTIHVPRGLGPYGSWEDAAVAALHYDFANWRDWTIGGALCALEKYNGFGYALRGMVSPYLWASTNQYIRGKFTADGHFDPAAIDHQLGCAGLLMRMNVADSSVSGAFQP
jgi:lysozyme family protein